MHELTGVIERDRSQLDALAGELATMIPGLDAAHGEESAASLGLERCEQALATWQQASDAHAQSVAAGQRETQVERARIEQLENQQHRLLQQRERQEAERAALAQMQPAICARDARRAGGARARCRPEGGRGACAVARANWRRPASASASRREALNAVRARWQQALGHAGVDRSAAAGGARQGVGQGHAMAQVPGARRASRALAQQLRVEHGWERAVETVLGSYLEAVCVDGLDSVADLLGSFDGGHLAVVSTGDAPQAPRPIRLRLQAKVQGAPSLGSLLSSVFAAETLRRGAARAADLARRRNRW